LSDAKLAEFARAFGAELIVSGKGPVGSMRRAATQAGCLTIILEAGEVWKVEPAVAEYAIRGIRNCLRHLGMVAGKPSRPAYRVETDATKWIRAQHGGFLRFHVAPGDIVAMEQPIATNTSLIGDEQNVILAPREGIVLGMTTLPSVSPGDPVCHLAFARRGKLKEIEQVVEGLDEDSLHERMRGDLATNLVVTKREDDEKERA
ncbi:MAG: succinylglutamate desuccinylase/aspartoacylase family protein, partial [Phycisphaerales bacterium]|nr:succinylglutamate desuccinylase/aspartoacylase family protein [Phycisphaerales bacterium]